MTDKATDNHVETILETVATDPVGREDPHPRLKWMRETQPVFKDEALKATMLTRYKDVQSTVNNRDMWRHPRLTEEGSLARMMIGDDRPPEEDNGILFMDEPDHSRVRLPIAKAFYARINKLKPEIEALIDGVIERAPKSGSFDLMSSIAVPVPILVIAHIIGVDETRLADFREWSEAAILSLNPVRTDEETKRMEWGSRELDDFFAQQMEERRRSPKEDLISDLVKLQADGTPLSDDEIRQNLESLLIGGNLTTTDLIGNGMWLLLNHPNELKKLRDDLSLAPQAIEEILRYEPPVCVTSRVVPGDMEIGGCPMHAHQSLWMSLQAANRDPAVYDDPEAFNITRDHVSHMSFGGGSHICIGAPLARIEAKQVFARLIERYSSIELEESDIRWRTLPFFRGIECLTIKVS